MADTDAAVRDLIYRSCLLLDEEDFNGYLDLCTPDFHYKITAYGQEIRREMTWLDLTREKMSVLFDEIPDHVRLPGTFVRMANVYTVDRQRESDRRLVAATTLITVYYTTPEGSTRVFAVGKYHDLIELNGVRPLLASRHVRLETRDIGKGCHVPL